jgi:hypothetical protein
MLKSVRCKMAWRARSTYLSQAQQLLVDMGVDPRAWIHAMATPKEQLYLFSQEELADLNWVTN